MNEQQFKTLCLPATSTVREALDVMDRMGKGILMVVDSAGKLLRTLESGELQRVGAVEARKVDVRVIAATNRDLEKEIAADNFRSDLYYRLSVVEVVVPPLRDRIEDIPYLTAAFLAEYSASFKKPISGLTPNAETALAQAPWPGNVRQLRNVIERASLLCEGNLLTEDEQWAKLRRIVEVAGEVWG